MTMASGEGNESVDQLKRVMAARLECGEDQIEVIDAGGTLYAYLPGGDAPAKHATHLERVGFDAGEAMDLTDELVDMGAVVRTDPVPPEERTRRGVLIGLTVAFALVFLLQVGFAVLGGDTWQRVGPVLSTAATLVGGGFGFVWGHYFSGRQ